MRKRISYICALTVLLCVISGCGAYSREVTEGVLSAQKQAEAKATIEPSQMPAITGYDAVAGNQNFYLYVSPQNLDIAVQDRRSGMVWNMIPDGWQKDTYASGPLRTYQASGLVLEIFTDARQTKTIASYTDCVTKNGFTLRKEKGGFEIDYVFSSCGIELTVRYELLESGLRFQVVPGSVREGEQGQYLSRIWVMPFFGSAAMDEQGFLFMPDGSGALLNFTGNPSSMRPQNKVVYGYDNAMSLSSAPNIALNYTLPVFGIKREAGAMLAIITKGDAMARITTATAGQGASRYREYSVFTYRDIHNIILYEGQQRERVVNEISPVPNEQMEVEYRFLNGDVSYSDMAIDYRNYLLENGLIRSNDTSFAMDLTLVGAIKKKQSIMGIPMDTVYPVTTFDQAVDILTLLKAKGVDNINLTYIGVNEGGLQNEKLGQFKPESVLGGSKAFDRFLEYTEKNGVSVTIASELSNVYRTGGAFRLGRNGVRQLTGAPSNQKVFNAANGDVESEYYLLSPEFFPTIGEKFIKSCPSGIGITFRDLCGKLYSQFDTTAFIPREEAKGYVAQTLSMLRATCGEVKIDGFNAYALPYATFLSGLPDTATMTDVESGAVPFYQIAVNGLLPYSAMTPGNAISNQQNGFLKQIEYGSFPKWVFGGISSDKIKDAKYNGLYSLYYADWIDAAAKQYAEQKAIYDKTDGFKIVFHEQLEQNIYRTAFENGTAVIVNYGNDEYISSSQSIKVPAKGYLLYTPTEGGSSDAEQ